MRTTGPGQAPLLLLDAVAILDRAGIRYAVVGAMAAAYHGAVRASLDADAVLFLKDESLAGLEAGFRNAGFDVLLRRGDPDDPIFSILVLSDVHGNRVDLLTGIRGMDPAAAGRTAESAYEGGLLRFIGLEDFVAMKLYAGSPTDVDDARRVLDVSRTALDLALVRTLAARFGGEAPSSLPNPCGVGPGGSRGGVPPSRLPSLPSRRHPPSYGCRGKGGSPLASRRVSEGDSPLFRPLLPRCLHDGSKNSTRFPRRLRPGGLLD